MNKKALIIFAKQPVPGEVKTRMVPPLSLHQAARLYHLMLTDILGSTESLTEVDRFIFYSGGDSTERHFHELFPGLPLCPQQGADLGRKMEAAFRSVFAMGYRTVAIIGSDSPDLPLSYIEDAFHLLENGRTQAVFGPAEDGGYYLLAMKSLYSELFYGIKWSSGQVLRESLVKAESAGIEAAMLPLWYDLDTFEALTRLGKADGKNSAPLTRQFVEGLDLLARPKE